MAFISRRTLMVLARQRVLPIQMLMPALTIDQREEPPAVRAATLDVVAGAERDRCSDAEAVSRSIDRALGREPDGVSGSVVCDSEEATASMDPVVRLVVRETPNGTFRPGR